MSRGTTALVVPTNRIAHLDEFLARWTPYPWDLTFVVEDGPARTPLPHRRIDQHVCWDDVGDVLGDDAWIVSRHDSGIRCFGFLLAVRAGATLVVTLDDDCFPASDGARAAFCDTHQRNLDAPPAWISSVPDVRVRGLPYVAATSRRRPAPWVNMGLWSGTADLDARQTLLGSPHAHDFVPVFQTQVVSRHHYAPFSGMNAAFRAEALPVMYFPKMGDDTPYHRFDDIWCGIVMQRIFAHLDLCWTIGDPVVVHARASDPTRNLVQEAPGLAAHEDYWRIVDAAPLTAGSLDGCVAEMGHHLGRQPDRYLQTWGHALERWRTHCAIAAPARRAESSR